MRRRGFGDSVSSQLPAHERAARGTRAGKATILAEEISPQEAAEILQISRPSVMRLIEKGSGTPGYPLALDSVIGLQVS
jgi:hypothetical protein